MKYTINLFCLIIILTTNTIHAQNLTGKLEYSVTIPKTFSILKKMKNQKKSEALINFTISIEEGIKSHIKYIKHQLIFNNEEAFYQLISDLNTNQSLGLKSAKILTGSNSLYYFDKNKNKIIRQTEAYGQRFLITSELNTRKWHLTQDTKTIGGYLCYKATSTLVTKNSVSTFYKPIIAWYAPKLPVPYGPKGYGGLPGLILQLTEGDFTFYVSKLTLNPKNGVKIKRPIKGKRVTQTEFEKIGEESSLNFKKMRN